MLFTKFKMQSRSIFYFPNLILDGAVLQHLAKEICTGSKCIKHSISMGNLGSVKISGDSGKSRVRSTSKESKHIKTMLWIMQENYHCLPNSLAQPKDHFARIVSFYRVEFLSCISRSFVSY